MDSNGFRREFLQPGFHVPGDHQPALADFSIVAVRGDK
jgi:hypothetical protein